jgi:hypothetical protein
MAGCESDAWNPLVTDFILIGHKLARLGFICSEGAVNVIELDEYNK